MILWLLVSELRSRGPGRRRGTSGCSRKRPRTRDTRRYGRSSGCSFPRPWRWSRCTRACSTRWWRSGSRRRGPSGSGSASRWSTCLSSPPRLWPSRPPPSTCCPAGGSTWGSASAGWPRSSSSPAPPPRGAERGPKSTSRCCGPCGRTRSARSAVSSTRCRRGSRSRSRYSGRVRRYCSAGPRDLPLNEPAGSPTGGLRQAALTWRRSANRYRSSRRPPRRRVAGRSASSAVAWCVLAETGRRCCPAATRRSARTPPGSARRA